MIRATKSRPDWERDGANWPNREASHFHSCNGLNWHIQEMGQAIGKTGGQKLLLLHGTGAATHSFRDLLPRLAERFHVIAIDLPAHGFTSTTGPTDLSLNGMAHSISALLKSINFRPDAILGHSAGAAIGIQLALGDPHIAHVFAVNAALKPIKGNAVFSPMAKLLFANPVSSRLFSMTASQSSIGKNLISSAGPEIDKAGHDAYTMLMGFPDHVRGAIGMMASWDLAPLQRRLPDLQAKLTLIVAKDDKLVPPADSIAAEKTAPNSELIGFNKGGHLLHEVRSAEIASIVFERLAADRKGKTP